MWRGSHVNIDLSFQDEVFVSCSSHFEAPVVPKVEHPSRIKLPPMFPSVGLSVSVVLLAVHVFAASGGGADTIGVEPWVVWDIIGQVELMYCLVDPH